ncbi:acyltransferase family protein [Pseudarthrobacter sp. PS3-L1]|uniref:acyltransferase family protein n=1 Tax=Pseudarthrobacter sp. PS3-L1 TaxID=3046207 RepID=UPI0024BA2A4A|nr:acyltransferase family protein [Pseudarthrobacter sp. PS3-L1]MDJ0321500.1 acyltransferase family protein [Pseudarthrobacter sp. PS3-L1]
MSAAPIKHSGRRLDLQGLRALAVGLVIVYHLWPSLLPGGFVGVDVFFVLSGYFIVGSLVREIQRTGSLSLTRFYTRRILRLLPASTVVLLATLAGALLVLPQSRWQSISQDVAMSALQIQNWHQAFSTGTYAGATALVSPVQHFWSLAVEEQFYLVIPVLLASVAWWRWMPGASLQSRCLKLLLVLFAVSFVHSTVLSQSHHDLAYFATSTRVWELAFGGILSLSGAVALFGAASRRVAGFVGLSAIALSALIFSTDLAFPGFLALLPVLGAGAIILAGESQSGGLSSTRSVTALFSTRPYVLVGDVSYSLYLWHWPVIVFFVQVSGRQPDAVDGIVLVAVSLGLAALSYLWVEQPFRGSAGARATRPFSRKVGRHARRGKTAFGFAAALIAGTVVIAAVPWTVMEMKFSSIEQTLNVREYPGALVMPAGQGVDTPPSMPVLPDPAVALRDLPMTAAGDCGVFDPVKQARDSCVFGAEDSARTMVVIGDSHAAQYVDPLVLAGAPTGWNVQAMVRNGCPFSSSPPRSVNTVFQGCADANALSVAMILDQKPDLVVVSGMNPESYARELKWRWTDDESLQKGYEDLLGQLRAENIRVAVVPDIPLPEGSVPDCVALRGSSPECGVPVPDRASHPDPLALAAENIQGVDVVNLDPYLCDEHVCPAVLGNVLVYRDNHLTNTFAKTLARPLGLLLGL